MAKVYSWEINKTGTYGYIVHPNYIDVDLRTYIGEELTGESLNKVIEWTSNCSDEEYIEQFNKLKEKCINERYNVRFENVENYLDVKSTCDNLRGPAGRGISHIRLISSDEITRKSIYAIYYDDETYDTFEVQNGMDGKDGVNGEPGTHGFDGVSSKFIMIYTNVYENEDDDEIIPPERPVGGKYNFITNEIEYSEGETSLEIQGWSTENNFDGIVYMSSRTFTTNEASTDKNWSLPVRITGDKGLPGADGTSIEFIYKLSKEEPNVQYLESQNETGFVPEGWTGSPSGVDENNLKEWCSIRTLNSNKEWGEWQKATIWSNYGVNGQDGDGVQYIYYRTETSTPPKNPTPRDYENDEIYQEKDGEWYPQQSIPYVNINGENVIYSEEWTDDPSGMDSKYQYEWVASRKYRKDVYSDKKRWGSFSNPSLWSKFGVDGKSGSSMKKIYALSLGSDSVPPIIKDDISGGSNWSTGFPTGYKIGKNVVWGSEAEIWSHNHEFVKSYQLVSTVDENGNVIPPIGANNINSIYVDSLPDEEDTRYEYLVYNYEYYKWKGGYCDPFLVTGLKGEDGQPINYTTYVFAYGFDGYIPNKPEGTTPDEPGTSLDGNGNLIVWMDFPDTSYGKVDGAIDDNTNVRRWYQCCGHVYGQNNTIKEWGEVHALNPKDGISGVYTEFRFGVTKDETKPQLVQYDSKNNIIREPELLENGNSDKKNGWFLSSEELPEVPTGGAMWQIWASIDCETDELVNGTKWSGPVKISGEKGETGEPGPAGARGIPGVSQNQMYCLGTSERQFASFDMGINDKKLPQVQYDRYNWLFSESIPDLNIFEAVDDISFKNFIFDVRNNGRVVKYNVDYYLVTNDKNSSLPYLLLKGYNGESLYIWCIQGRDIYGETPNFDENGDYIPEGVSWCRPFKLQGMNGLPGKDGSKGQITYPMGLYNVNEVYTTTDKKAPYVIDPNDGLYYVLNKQMSWVGALPTDYKTIVIHPNDADNDAYSCNINEIPTNYKGDYIRVTQPAWKYPMYFKWNGNEYIIASKFKYSSDGSGGELTWLTAQGSGNTPSVDYANNSANGTNCWERFESFDALYASVAIVENGTIGSAVFNGEYMFSQQGINSEGVYSDSYEKFNNREPYNENNEFRPNICIDFKKGDMWASQGNIKFSNGDIILNGYIKKQKTILTPSNISYYIKEQENSKSNNTRASTSQTPDLVISGATGVTLGQLTGPVINYIDLNKIGSYVSVEGVFNDEFTLCLHSLPGNIIYDNSNYDEVRGLIGNMLYIVNKSNKAININTYAKESQTDKDTPSLRTIKIDKDNFFIFNCVAGAVNLRERIYWEYDGGKIAENINPNETYNEGWGQCITIPGISHGSCDK